MISVDTLLQQDDEPIATTVDQEVVMLSIRAGAYFGMNSLGSEIWNLLSEPRRFGELCAILLKHYEVDEETLAREVRWFLEGLVERGLVRIVDETGTQR